MYGHSVLSLYSVNVNRKDAVETRRTTLRCPADITFFLNQKYEGQVMCTSSVTRSVSHEVIQGAAVMNPVSKPLKGKVITHSVRQVIAALEGL